MGGQRGRICVVLKRDELSSGECTTQQHSRYDTSNEDFKILPLFRWCAWNA